MKYFSDFFFGQQVKCRKLKRLDYRKLARMEGSYRRNLPGMLHTPSPGSQDPDSPLPPYLNPGPNYDELLRAASDGDANRLFTTIITEIMEEQEAVSLSSTFPNPPPFWKDFTTDKIARYEQLRKEHDEDDGDKTTENDGFKPQARIDNLPEELIHLQPPAEPTDGRWRVFGDQYMVRRRESPDLLRRIFY